MLILRALWSVDCISTAEHEKQLFRTSYVMDMQFAAEHRDVFLRYCVLLSII